MREEPEIIKLRKTQLEATRNAPEYQKLLESTCQRIVDASAQAPNEATIESRFDCELFHFFKLVFDPFGIKYEPHKEAAVGTKRHIAKGRADTVIGALIIEFKQPSTLEGIGQQDNAVRQITEYLEGFSESATGTLVGFVTDGTKGCFVSLDDEGLIQGEFLPLSADILDRVIESVIALHQTALTAKNLANDFCSSSSNQALALNLFLDLFGSLENMSEKTNMLFNEWKELFNLAHDDVSKQQAILDRKYALGVLAHEKLSKKDDEYKALFALQTSYAIIVKIVAYRVISRIKYGDPIMDFSQLSSASSDGLRLFLADLEDGAVFRKYGISNLLEGDFFSWYSSEDQWSDELSANIKKIFATLSPYSDKSVLNNAKPAQDFFKDLYEVMMPASVRHSLGEYYTQPWLAKKVVEDALQQADSSNWRGLDPCCGSGTFITMMIEKLQTDLQNKDSTHLLDAILNRVAGIDLNPVAVLTARVNYFINIAHLLQDCVEVEIPIYLGDAAYVPQEVMYGQVDCIEYSLKTLQYPIDIVIPKSAMEDKASFQKAMVAVEKLIKIHDREGIFVTLQELVDTADLTQEIIKKLQELADMFVTLEEKNWNGIWARVVTNFLMTANLGKFDLIVGNPPWVDWKNLPSGYRERIKSFCVSRKVFSGDSQTGGINLNICALIASVAAENWISAKGVLAFLMPEPLIYQQSYEGFRNLYTSSDERLYFQKFTNWTKAGNPFKPVTQKFLTYFISRKSQNYEEGIEMDWYFLNKGMHGAASMTDDFDEFFTKKTTIVATCHKGNNAFSHVSNLQQAKMFRLIAGASYYRAREGVEFYPQELMIFNTSGQPSKNGCTAVKNIKTKRPKYSVPQSLELLETEWLHPLVKGVDVNSFHVEITENIVPFPYERENPKYPIGMEELTNRAPNLAEYYRKSKALLLSQSAYNERIIGKQSEFYALARVGAYSFAENFVVFRDNTKWGAAVISHVPTKWGGDKRPLFQNHAVSISQDINGNFITLDEAHFICGIINAPIVKSFMLQSSDTRTFPVKLRVAIPKYDECNEFHAKIAAFSKEAHLCSTDKQRIDEILNEIDKLYLTLVGFVHNT